MSINWLPAILNVLFIGSPICLTKNQLIEASAEVQTKATENPAQTIRTQRVKESVTYCLEYEDWKKFRTGRSKREILEDICWYGSLHQSANLDGKITTSIAFGINGGYLAPTGCQILAIFEENKFVKFVEFPSGHTFPEKLGAFSYLRLCRNAPAVDAAKLDRDSRQKSIKEKFNPGLTVAVLPVMPILASQHEIEVRKNVRLRDQFNASRIELGMMRNEIGELFRAKPLYTGKADGVFFAIYGTDEPLDLADKSLHYSNIIVIFEQDKVAGIACVEGGRYGLRTLSKYFKNLPEDFKSKYPAEETNVPHPSRKKARPQTDRKL